MSFGLITLLGFGRRFEPTNVVIIKELKSSLPMEFFKSPIQNKNFDGFTQFMKNMMVIFPNINTLFYKCVIQVNTFFSFL